MKLWLAVVRSGVVVEAVVLSWSKGCWSRMIPKRKSDLGGEIQGWLVPLDRRRVLGKYVCSALDGFNADNLMNHSEEVLHGFFNMVGVGKRWVDDVSVDWLLFPSERDLVVGEKLGVE